MRKFLWCPGNSSKGNAKVAWDVVCLPKDEGGLGIRRLDRFNSALMVTHLWKLPPRLEEALWVKWRAYVTNYRDPYLKNPNSVPPARGSDDVIKRKRASRSGHSDVKLAPKYTFAISKPAVNSGKKGNKKSGIRGKELKRIVEDVEIDDAESDGSDVRNEDDEVCNTPL
ncbi:hypothetical protein Tco_0151687 [Tanacetum coccineum]